MKRAASILLLAALALAPAFCNEPAKSSGGEESGLKTWEWVNFLILAGGLGYVAGKQGGPFLAARSRKIAQDLAEAASLREQAEARAAEVEKRMAGIESRIGELRAEARQEAQAEAERVARESAAEAVKIQAQAEQDIEAAVKAARADLKRHAAELAVDLAEGLIRARMTPESQDALVQDFVRNLDRTSERRSS
ncbi:MAG TPA: ATP synthase F0 subunit B [Bryobacteraceae bacterium]|nr:ATP synthase F0 subunit B [Bryobacteraceae bacterium]